MGAVDTGGGARDGRKDEVMEVKVKFFGRLVSL
jgi:hypothetical protein